MLINMRVLSLILLITVPFISGLSCPSSQTPILQDIVLEPPPYVEALIPDPINKNYAEDGSYCTESKETGHRFFIFKENEKASPVENWKEESEGFNIHISSRGVLDLLNYFKSIICSEALIICSPLGEEVYEGSSPKIFVGSEISRKIQFKVEEIEEILKFKMFDSKNESIAKLILRKSFDPLKQFANLAIESERIRNSRREI